MNLQPIDSERRRVARHIRRAERIARTRTLDALSPAQHLVRALLLDELARYRAAGRFPRVEGFDRPTPAFVDAHGTRCAMAHMLDLGGESALVERIARERNHARVRELADEPRLRAWLAAAGITLGEAEVIQPGYCSTPVQCICGGGFAVPSYGIPSDYVLEAIVNRPPEQGAGTATVLAIFGPAPGVLVGQQLRLPARPTGPLVAGAHILVPYWHGTTLNSIIQSGDVALLLSADGSYTCHGQGGDSPPIAPADFARAITASQCALTLNAMGDVWSGRQCGDLHDEGYTIGCNAAQPARADTPSTLGVLCAVVTALIARRARRA